MPANILLSGRYRMPMQLSMDHVQVFPDGELDVKDRVGPRGLTFERQTPRSGANGVRSSTKRVSSSQAGSVRPPTNREPGSGR